VNSLNEIKAKLKEATPITWLFTGDSITQGALHTYGYRSFPEIFAEHVRWEMSRKMDIVINSGISGNKTSDILDTIDWRILRFKPNVIFLMIGTNDCALGRAGCEIFEQNLCELLEIVRSHGCFCVLNTPNAICLDGYSGSYSHLPEYVEIIRKVARSSDIMLIDHFEYWNQTKATKDELMSWLDDSIHPNVYGHRAIAKLIFQALCIENDKPTCHLFIS
jgi:lysophospholipase L1-like esterase